MMTDETRAVMELLDGFYPRAERVGLGPAREQIAAMAAGTAGTGEPVARVEDRTIPRPAADVPVRVYWPSLDQGLPVMAFFHGGGFTICNLDTHDGQCRAIANRTGAIVVSVDYGLAPEHRFPAPVEDCYAATRWLADHAAELGGDAARLAVAGDSAGGNLAAAVTLAARERGGPAIRFQLLVYPVIDLSSGRDVYESHRTNAEGYFLTHAQTEWIRTQYLASEEDGEHPLASPIVADDLSGLPPALVVTAEFDPLRDEGEAYATRLRAAGVEADILRVPDMFHGFFGMMAALPAATWAMDEACARVRRQLVIDT